MKALLLGYMTCLWVSMATAQGFMNFTWQKLNIKSAALYREGKYEEALAIAKKALAAARTQAGKYDLDFATQLTELADVCSSMSQYDVALPLYQQATSIFEKTLSKKHPAYAANLMRLAVMYHTMGQYELALSLYHQASKVFEQTRQHSLYTASLIKMADIYRDMGQYEKAMPLYQQVLDKKNAVNNGNLRSLGDLYSSMGQYEKALPLYEEVLQRLKEKQVEANRLFYAATLNSLATLYSSMGQYEKAMLLFEQALAMRQQMLGKNHPLYAQSLNNLAGLHEKMGQYEKAMPLYQQSRALLLAHFRTQMLTLSEQQAQAYQNTLLENFDVYNSFAVQHQHQLPALKAWPLENALFWKGLLLQQTTALRRSIRTANDSSLTTLFVRWQRTHQQLAQQTEPEAQLQDQVEELEQQLSRRSAAYRRATQDTLPGLTTLRAALQVGQTLRPRQALVEFTHFRFHNRQHWTDSTYYYASVLTPTDSLPRLIFLCEARQLDTLLEATTSSATSIQHFYANRGVKVGTGAAPGEATAQRLYQLVWQPLQPLLQGYTTVYYVPSGQLHKLAMAALPIGHGKLLGDTYSLHQLSSSRVLILPPVDAHPQAGWQAALYGAIDYQADSTALAQATQALPQPPQDPTALLAWVPSPARALGGALWGALPATAREVDDLRTLLQQAAIEVQAYSAAAASEESIKALGRGHSPQLLHLATHGFFVADPVQKREDTPLPPATNRFKQAENPLLRSGLVLAGANRVWQGLVPYAGLDDGILTAFEVSQLDLSSTRLVVLSACETALGEIKGSEGVFGLQRAFKAAGVPYLLMSLWQVPDQETAQMMQLFYKGYLSGVPIEEAFRQAQTAMRKTYDPYYWAAFVLVR